MLETLKHLAVPHNLFVPRYPAHVLILSERARLILRLIWHYRLLSSEQIEILFKHRQARARTKEERDLWSPSTAEKELRELFNFGYVLRPPRQVQFLVDPAEDMGHHLIYAITRKGVKALEQKLTTNHSWKNQRLSVSNLKHGLAISDFRLALELSCDRKGIELVFWKRDKSPELNAFMDPGGTKQSPGELRQQFGSIFPSPDGAFVIDHWGRRKLFLVEVDTGSMSRNPLMAKYHLLDEYERRRRSYLKHYWLTLASETQRDHAQGPTGKEVILSLRILTVARDARRRDKVIKWLQLSGLRSHRFLVAAREEIVDFDILDRFWTKSWYTPHPDGELVSIEP